MKQPRWTRRAGRRPIALVALVVGAVVVALSVAVAPAGASPPAGSTALSASSLTADKSAVAGTSGSQTGAIGHVTVGHSTKNDRSAPLRSIATPATEQAAAKSQQVLPLPVHQQQAQSHPDTAVQSQLAAPNMPATQLNFNGIPYPGVSCFCAPPDTNGEVGETQYVQIVNEGLQVFDKTTGTSQLGPVAITSLWNGFGGPCQTTGEGDPVVLYDQIAQRWVVTQFASFPPTFECVAVSTTSDATGTYNRYAFDIGSQFGVNFYDYPKLSVWPDAYYLSFNVYDAAGQSFLGPQPFALDRSAMLAGQPATVVSTGKLTSNDDQLMPADLDGANLPPAGAPNPFTEIGTNSTWKLWRFHVDFANPGNSTFTLAGTLTPDPFTVICGGTGAACVPQAGVPDVLDTLGDRSMFRSAYRHFPDGHEALVGNMTVQSNGVAGIRWWELKNVTSGTPAFAQQSTYQPDDTWRWMGSAAMDAQGDIAIGFSASSATINPQIRYAGRLAGDPPNTLAQGEAHLFDGTGSQEFVNRGRWGDYSDLTVDPSDDCTFWYTTEYYPTISSFNWRTRIGSFKFPNCTAGPSGTLAGTVTDASTHNPIAGAEVDTQFGSTSTDSTGHYSFNLPVGSYSIGYSRFGYASDTENNVAITDGATTTVNVALQPSPAVSVTGTITDGSGHGWPLYTRISVAGDPDGPFFTNPITGQYSIQLPANASYNVTYQSQLSGYQAVSESVAVGGSAMTHNVPVPVAPNCTAPGYTTGTPCVVVPGGLVEGNVFDLNTGAAINGAKVTSNDKPAETATTFATPDDPNNPDGYYWLFSSLTGSHAFTASIAKHSDDTHTVNVVADNAVRQDYSLGAGHVTISASSISSTQVLGTTATQTLSFHNDGTGPAHVKLNGCCGSFQLRSPSTGHFSWIQRPADEGVDMPANGSGSAEAFPSAAQWQSDTATASDPKILIYSDDLYHPSPNTYVDQALKRLGLSYTAFYDANFTGFESALATGGPWDTVILADDDFIPPSTTLTALNNYVLGGGKLIVDSWTVATNPSPLWTTVGFKLGSVDTDPPSPVHWWEPDHPVFTNPETVPEFTQLTGGRYGTYGQRGDGLDGFQSLAGGTTTPAAGQAALILGNDDRTIFKGFMDGQNDADIDADGVRDGVELWTDMVSGIVQGFSVPWLAESPAEFDVPVGGTVDVTVTLSATTADGVTQPGTDSAQLLVSTNTPQTFTPLGVTMNVTPPNGWGKLAGTLSGTDCSGKNGPLKGVVFADGKSYSYTLKTDSNGGYSFWAPSAANPITLTASASGWIAQSQKANIRIGKTTTINFTLRPVTC